MKNKPLTFNFVLLLLVFTVATPLLAADYYVDQNHPSANDQNPGTIDQPWKTITKANQTLNAGDTVYIRAGTYNSYIAPVNSGTSNNRIIFEGVGQVTITGQSYAVYLNDDYITVKGIDGSLNTYMLYIDGGDYNIIDDCEFTDDSGNGWDTSRIRNGSQYNWIKNSTFGIGGECTGGGVDEGSVLDIGSTSSDDGSSYNLIEDCTFYHGGHHLVGLWSANNVFRNNYLHNEAWSLGKGNRALIMDAPDGVAINNLVENNRFGYSAAPCDDNQVSQFNLSTESNIIRYNSFYHGNASGLVLYAYSPGADGSYNRIYNNTFFNNGDELFGGTDSDRDAAVSFLKSRVTGNVLKNNLYYSHYQLYGWEFATPGNQTFANNFDGDVSGDPLFTNAPTTPPGDKTDSTLPNLNLQSGSPAINQGGALTTVATADTGTGTSLIVDDATYFQDGTWGLASEVDADYIAVGTVNNTVQISSINYSTNTITLASSITRNDGDAVWLYKKSDGTQVLYGSAPDAGAYEFSQMEVAPSAPTNLRIIP